MVTMLYVGKCTGCGKAKQQGVADPSSFSLTPCSCGNGAFQFLEWREAADGDPE